MAKKRKSNHGSADCEIEALQHKKRKNSTLDIIRSLNGEDDKTLREFH